MRSTEFEFGVSSSSGPLKLARTMAEDWYLVLAQRGLTGTPCAKTGGKAELNNRQYQADHGLMTVDLFWSRVQLTATAYLEVCQDEATYLCKLKRRHHKNTQKTTCISLNPRCMHAYMHTCLHTCMRVVVKVHFFWLYWRKHFRWFKELTKKSRKNTL